MANQYILRTIQSVSISLRITPADIPDSAVTRKCFISSEREIMNHFTIKSFAGILEIARNSNIASKTTALIRKVPILC